MDLPGSIPRSRIVAAFEALGLADDDDQISSVEISGTEVEVGLFVMNEDGSVLTMLGEYAQVYVTLPVDEAA
jgi:hypothetical protein